MYFENHLKQYNTMSALCFIDRVLDVIISTLQYKSFTCSLRRYLVCHQQKMNMLPNTQSHFHAVFQSCTKKDEKLFIKHFESA